MDSELISRLSGLQKWTVGALGAMYASKLPTIIDKVRTMPAVAVLDIFPEGGGIDVDTIYHAIKTQADKCPVTFDAPLIGSITLNTTDIDVLYNTIRNS